MDLHNIKWFWLWFVYIYFTVTHKKSTSKLGLFACSQNTYKFMKTVSKQFNKLLILRTSNMLPWRHFRTVLSSINPSLHKHNFLPCISLQTTFPDVPLHWSSISHFSYSCLLTNKYKFSSFVYLFFKHFIYLIR